MVNDILNILKNADSIGILSHIHADGDALGSQLALAQGLRHWGKEPVCLNRKPLPKNMAFLPGYDQILLAQEDGPWPEVVVSVDCGSLDRTGLPKRPQGIATWINIDHHEGNSFFGDLNVVNPQAAATCEMMADFFGPDKLTMNPDVATCLYTGLSTDTGSFKYANTSAATMALAGRLMEAGADTDAIRLHVYESMSRGKFAMMQALFSKTRFLAQGKVASTAISFQDAEALSPGETGFSGIVAQLKEIDGVEVAMLCRELASGATKVSFRSKTVFDCNAFAASYGGGGHVRAAGVTLDRPLDFVQAELERALVAAVGAL